MKLSNQPIHLCDEREAEHSSEANFGFILLQLSPTLSSFTQCHLSSFVFFMNLSKYTENYISLVGGLFSWNRLYLRKF